MNGKPLLPRLRDHEPSRGAPADTEARAGEIIRGVPRPGRLAPEAHARILQRLRGEPSPLPPSKQRATGGPTPLQLLGGAAVLAIGAGAALSWRHSDPPSRLQSLSAHLPAPQVVVPMAMPSTSDPVVIAERPKSMPPKTSTSSASPAASSSLAEESRLLSLAFDQLHARRDAQGALATLSIYDARFPNGVLRSEAVRTRLGALTALGQWSSALALLDDGIGERALTLEMRVLRGELRAGAGRCAEATTDLDSALAERGPTRLVERALYARASCRAQLGDRAGATSDLNEYLLNYPNGAHAAEARRRLEK